MKTNHQRDFKDTTDPKKYGHSPMGSVGRSSDFADIYIAANWGGDNSNGHRGIAKARRGGKKFVNSRVRFHENALLKKVCLQNEEDWNTP